MRMLDEFVQSGRVPEKSTVLAGIQNYAIESSVDFAVQHLRSAMIFLSKQDVWKCAYKMSPISRTDRHSEYRERERASGA